MNKKQGIIITVLLALIICVGVLATRLNNPLEGTDVSSGVISFNGQENSAKGEDVFSTLKTDRSQRYAANIQNYKTIIDNKNSSDESKKQAEKKYLETSLNQEYETSVETTLQSKGYGDVLCLINEGTAKVMLNSNVVKEVDDKQAREIKDEVSKISKVSTVEIELKK